MSGGNPIALAEGMAAMATALDLMEAMVQEAMARGYTEEQARQLVIHLITLGAQA